MNNETMIDLSNYQKRVIADDDKPLFDEAVKSAQAGALRGSYILLWLSCLESLKRKFREAALRDGNAGKIVGNFETAEKSHKSVDKIIISEAQKYGFVSDYAYQKLEHIYDMRCIFGHPYEEAPSLEDVRHAACTVVEQVLSKPTTLKKGYVSSLINKLMEKPYLDDYEPAVRKHAEDITPRIDKNVYTYLVETYLKKIEPNVHDFNLELLINRAIWFLHKFLKIVGCRIYSAEQWHNLVMQYPKTLCLILAKNSNLFKEIGQKAQDSIIGYLIDDSDTRPSGLGDLECLYEGKVLTNRQKAIFEKAIEKSKMETLKASGLKTSTCFDKIIEALESHNWYTQNTAMKLIIKNGVENFGTLNTNQAEILGRNILQVADGKERVAIQFLDGQIGEPNFWSNDILRGALLECFLDDDYKFRLKTKHLNKIMRILSNHDEKDELINFLYTKVKDSDPKRLIFKQEVNDSLEILNKYPEAVLITEYLQNFSQQLSI